MPSNMVKRYAEQSGKSVEQVEKIWTACKKQAKHVSKTEDEHYWAYVNLCTRTKLGLDKKKKQVKKKK